MANKILMVSCDTAKNRIGLCFFQGVYAKFSPPPVWHFYSSHPTFKTFSPSPPPDWKATPLFFYSQNPTPPVAQNAPPLPLVFAATVPRAAIAQFCWGTIMSRYYSRSQEVKVGGGRVWWFVARGAERSHGNARQYIPPNFAKWGYSNASANIA